MFFVEEGFTYRNFLIDALAIFVLIVWFWLLITIASDLFRRRAGLPLVSSSAIMDRSVIQERLAETEEQIANGENQIAQQRRRIAGLRGDQTTGDTAH